MWNFLTGLIKPISDVIDCVITADEQRLNAKAKLLEMQNTIAAKFIEYENQLLKAKTEIITAEAQGTSWLQRAWRPITMLTFLVLVVADTFGLTTFRLAPQAWTLLQIGLGGYVVGRSVEKILPKTNQLTKKD